ncbi:MAG: PrgI family protein, partial [Candidatus Bathyarchaeota archaeon]|nr:PrgI family protein [Candidatus Bathyarchaeota archaeon]
MEPRFEQEHPIPQQISAYEFHLVGDMTLKQFFQVAGGALVALIFYSSALPQYVKWPAIIISFLFGVAFAFFPLQDRPLATWIGLFIKAIYSPTAYYWKR